MSLWILRVIVLGEDAMILMILTTLRCPATQVVGKDQGSAGGTPSRCIYYQPGYLSPGYARRYDMVDTNTNLDNNANVELISGVNYYDAVLS